MRRGSAENNCNINRTIFLVFLLANFSTLLRNCDAQDRTVRVAQSSAVANTSDNVKITESTEMPADYVLKSIKRTEKRIGIYHRELKRFVLWNGNLTRGERQNSLPNALLAPHGISLKDFGDGRAGVQYEFNAPDPGVFIVNTTWTLRPRATGDSNLIERTGNPVLIFVNPASDYDDQDQPIDLIKDGSSLQNFLEKKFDDNPDETGVLLPKFN